MNNGRENIYKRGSQETSLHTERVERESLRGWLLISGINCMLLDWIQIKKSAASPQPANK